MKILFAHDPEANEPTLIADLQRAGFPTHSTVLVFAVADILTPPASGTSPAAVPPRVQAAVDAAQQRARAVQAELQRTFPNWTITSEVVTDAPAWGIIRKAGDWKPDVIVVGAHRQSAVARLVLGSVSQKVLHEAGSTVRVVKAGSASSQPPRLMLGVDGSRDAEAAVAAVVARTWPAGTSVLLTTVLDDATEKAPEHGHPLCERVAGQLKAAGLNVSTTVVKGDPTDALLAEAERWKPDCIFVGARGLSGIQRLILGSVSSTLAARATCSVEVVRAG